MWINECSHSLVSICRHADAEVEGCFCSILESAVVKGLWSSFIYFCPRSKVSVWDYQAGRCTSSIHPSSNQNLSCNLTLSSPGQRLEFIQCGGKSASGFETNFSGWTIEPRLLLFWWWENIKKRRKREIMTKQNSESPVHEIQRGTEDFFLGLK